MHIRWDNIFGLLLLIFGIYLFVKMGPFFENLFTEINQVYYYGDGPGQLLKVLMLGLICLTVLAAITIISNRRR